ncbi:DUF2336 domain-containing protein [Propylenella binzhouense]|uniref:DUF2336 domain-containing protein n=1 Tax=Propylenella binzhouense TaxID=2555902 RepID=UPI0013722AE8
MERFLHWMGSAPVPRRAEAAHALARAFLYSALSEEERDGIEATLTVLLDDPSPDVRLALADAVADSDQAPHHLVLGLAADRVQIAALVAERSPILFDSELVDLIGTREEAVQVAIARRPVISRAVAAALSEVASARVCVELLCNPGARIARFSLDRMVERHGGDPELRELLLGRCDLPVEIRQALVARLSTALRDFAVSRNWLPADRAELVTRDACERVTIAMAFEAPAEEMPNLVDALARSNALTPALLVRAIASGQTLFFETALEVLAEVPHDRVAGVVRSGRASALRALLARAKLPERTFAAFEAAVEVLRSVDGEGAGTDYRRATRLIDAIIARYGSRADKELDQILALLRRFAAEAKREAARDYIASVMQAA